MWRSRDRRGCRARVDVRACTRVRGAPACRAIRSRWPRCGPTFLIAGKMHAGEALPAARRPPVNHHPHRVSPGCLVLSAGAFTRALATASQDRALWNPCVCARACALLPVAQSHLSLWRTHSRSVPQGLHRAQQSSKAHAQKISAASGQSQGPAACEFAAGCALLG